MAGLRDNGGIGDPGWLDPLDNAMYAAYQRILPEQFPLERFKMTPEQWSQIGQWFSSLQMPSLPALPTEPEWLRDYRLRQGLPRMGTPEEALFK